MSRREGRISRILPWLMGFTLACALLLVLLVGALASIRELPVSSSGSRDRVVIGAEEQVELSAEEHQEPIRVLADVDTGAYYSSINRELVGKLGINLQGAKTVSIETAIGEDKRPLVNVQMTVAGKTLDTKVTVSDREELGEKALLGRRNLRGFLVDPSRERLTSPDSPRAG